MFKFITGRKGYTLERAKIVKELFAFSRTVSHGFPHSPSCLAYDDVLSLMCICTKTGAVRVYGAPGVEFVGYHAHEGPVVQAHFIPGEGRLVTLQDNNELSLWEVVDSQLVLVETIDDFAKTIFSMCVTPNKKQILIGTEQGDVYVLDVETFKFTDTVVQRDLITEKVPDDFKISPGGVECLRCLNQEQCIVGYQRGILVLFDIGKLSAKQTYISRKDLSSIYVVDESKFVSCHTDGGYAVWSTILSSSTKQVDQIYGPHACKAVNKLYAFDNERTLIFSGGMPRSQYGDRFTLSVHRGPIERKVFEFTSKVVDFFIVNKKVVVVLAEEEVVAISLQDLKPIQLPYLFPLHCSAITNVVHAPAVPKDIVEKLTDSIQPGEWSTAKWPIQGGKLPDKVDTATETFDLILTGHEDGSVRIYDASAVAMRLLACVKTGLIFNERCHDASRAGDQDEDEFLQFTKVGQFDPYSDDPRFAVKKLAFSSSTGTLVVGGTAGQVIVLGFKQKKEVQIVTLNLVGDRDHFVWKGHEALSYDRESSLSSQYYVQTIVQVSPPAGLTALALTEKWNLISAGTAHGFGCVDLQTEQVVMFKCTLNESDLGGAGAHSGNMVRRKSFKKSLRESFRRLRKGRSQRGKTAKNLEDVKPVERQVESRIMQDDGQSSMVRSLVFSDAYILSHSSTSRTFWASTNAGSVFVYSVKRSEGDSPVAMMNICKEIHLRHHAPVLGVFVIDSHGFLCHDGPPKESATPNLWRVVICSEEQIKVFSLPQFKPLQKVKLTAHEGSWIRKLQVAEFRNSERSEYCLVTMTNQGQIIVFSLPDLRRIITADCCRKDDINGISSTMFTPLGEGFYLNSASEFDRVSVSATKVTAPTGILDLPEDVRPRRVAAKEAAAAAKASAEPVAEPVKEKEVVKERKSTTPEKRRSSTPEKRRSTSLDARERKVSTSGSTPEKAAAPVVEVSVDKPKKAEADKPKKTDVDKPKKSKKEDKERKVDVKESHEKKEKHSMAVEKAEDGSGEKTVETAQVAERKVKQQVEEGEDFKVETVEVVVTKKAVVVSEETKKLNGADAMKKIEAMTKDMQIDDVESPNTDSGISSVLEQLKSPQDVTAALIHADDSTIVIERHEEQVEQMAEEKKLLEEITEKVENNVKVVEQKKTEQTQRSQHTKKVSSHTSQSTTATTQAAAGGGGGGGGGGNPNQKNNRGRRRRGGRNGNVSNGAK